MRRYSVVFLLCLFCFPLLFSGSQNSLIPSLVIEKTSNMSYTPISNITIDGDEDFVNGGWPGNGDPWDPYIIDGYNISTTDTYAIYIRNTVKHFLVNNCYIPDDSISSIHAVYLSNVSNGVFQNIHIVGRRGYSFLVWSSDHVTLNNVTIQDGGNRGLDIGYCDNIIVLGSYIHTPMARGLHLNNVESSIFYDVSFYSHHIELIDSYYLNFTEVTSDAYLSYSGFDIESCNSSIFTRCVANSCGIGFNVYDTSQNNTFDGCIANENSLQNFYINTCDNNTLQNCISYGNNDEGYNVENSDFIVFRNNTAYANSGNGARFDYCDNCSFYNNYFYDNDATGIYLRYCNYTYMYATNSSGNGDRGINFSWSHYATIEHCNTTENGGIGIYHGYGGQHSNIEWNYVDHCGGDGIYVHDGYDVLIANNTVTNPNQKGITPYSCENSIVEDNEIFDCSYGIYNYGSTYCFVRNNVIADTYYGIYSQSGDHMLFDNNNITGARQGYRIYFGTNYTVSNAYVSDSYIGYLLFQSTSSNLTNVHSEACDDYGIQLEECWNVTVSDSEFVNCYDDDILLIESEQCHFYSVTLGERGVRIDSAVKEDWYHYFTDVTVIGKPLLYVANGTDLNFNGANYEQAILVNCTDSSVTGASFTNHSIGATAAFCSGGAFDEVSVDNSTTGIYVYFSDSFNVTSCNVENCPNGIVAYSSVDTFILSCSVNDSSYCINIDESEGTIIQDTNATHALYGINIDTCNNAFVENCVIGDISGMGLRFYSSTNSSGVDNYIYLSSKGLVFQSVVDCNMTGTVIDNCWEGIFLSGSAGVFLDHIQTINATSYSLAISGGVNVTITSVNFDGQGIRLSSSGMDGYDITIEDSELNGKPIGQLRNESGIVDASLYSQLFLYDCYNMTVYNSSFDVGMGLFIFSCDNVTVQNFDSTGTYGGIKIAYSSYIYLYDIVLVDETDIGVRFLYSDYLVIDNATITGNTLSAITLTHSNYLNLTNSIIIDAAQHGLYLYYSDYAYIENNTFFENLRGIYNYRSDYCQGFYNGFFNNSYGIYVDNGEDNSYIHNEFGYNTVQAFDNGILTAWDNGIDSGNAWSDYVSGGNYPIGGMAGSSDGFPTTLGSTSPVLSSPSDSNFFEGQTGNMISWTISGRYLQSYTVSRNGTIVQQGRISSSIVIVYADGLANGDYEYILTAFNVMGESDTDTVIVSILPLSTPDITPLDNLTFYHTKEPSLVTWTATDLYPYEYEIYLDDELVASGEWNETSIIYYLSQLGVGEHNLTLLAISECGNFATDTIWLTVIALSTPFINHPADIQYMIGQTGFDITWFVSDSYPDSFELYRNGTLIDSGDWDGSDISLSLDSLDTEGIYNYTLVVFSECEESSSDTVLVTVLPAPTTPTTTTTTGTTTTTTTETTTSPSTPSDNQGMIMLSIGLVGGLAVGVFISCIFTKVKKD
ncbi:MAG: hypothetical protein GF411_09230 [Candidatus Lokiarchaeota archaeon]|nr:hypothetical protein [Candidatus Lokiarchaeota archaeon]